MNIFTNYISRYKTWILANKWLSVSIALFLFSFLFSWFFLFVTCPFLAIILATKFNKLNNLNSVLRNIVIIIIGILAVPLAFIPALASPNAWSYMNSPEVQKSIQVNKERDEKLAQEKKQKEESDRLEQEKKKQEQEDRAKFEEEKVKSAQEAEKKAKQEQIKVEEQKKQEQVNQELATKINNDITFDSEIASQEVKQAAESNKLIANLQTSTKGKKTFKVQSVVDGDTIKLDEIGTVRMIGIDTPETKDPRKPVQCFGQEASNKIGEFLNNSSVYLEFDPAQRIDKYGRTLAYVFREDNLDINLEMVKQGFAFAYTKYPNPRSQEFVNAQTEARSKQAGLWSPSTCNGEQKEIKKEVAVVAVPQPTPQPSTPKPVQQPAPTSNVAPGEQYYAGTCTELKKRGLGNFPRGSVNYSAARDRDGDGMACEL
jgi:micrococcal nuclease